MTITLLTLWISTAAAAEPGYTISGDRLTAAAGHELVRVSDSRVAVRALGGLERIPIACETPRDNDATCEVTAEGPTLARCGGGEACRWQPVPLDRDD